MVYFIEFPGFSDLDSTYAVRHKHIVLQEGSPPSVQLPLLFPASRLAPAPPKQWLARSQIVQDSHTLGK
jgi:hypothetical protein